MLNKKIFLLFIFLQIPNHLHSITPIQKNAFKMVVSIAIGYAVMFKLNNYQSSKIDWTKQPSNMTIARAIISSLTLGVLASYSSKQILNKLIK